MYIEMYICAECICVDEFNGLFPFVSLLVMSLPGRPKLQTASCNLQVALQRLPAGEFPLQTELHADMPICDIVHTWSYLYDH